MRGFSSLSQGLTPPRVPACPMSFGRRTPASPLELVGWGRGRLRLPPGHGAFYYTCLFVTPPCGCRGVILAVVVGFVDGCPWGGTGMGRRCGCGWSYLPGDARDRASWLKPLVRKYLPPGPAPGDRLGYAVGSAWARGTARALPSIGARPPLGRSEGGKRDDAPEKADQRDFRRPGFLAGRRLHAVPGAHSGSATHPGCARLGIC